MTTKQQILDDVCKTLGLPKAKVSRGSTEPRSFLLDVIFALGITNADVQKMHKIELAKLVVESFGYVWHPSFESTGSTITKHGLHEIQRIVHLVSDR